MKLIEEFFKKTTKEIAFIELKKGSSIAIKDYRIKNIPLPIITDNLVREIEEGKIEEGIDISKIIDGIIYIMGADKNFPYIDDYKDMLLAYNSNMENYIIHQASMKLQQGDIVYSGLWLRALLELNSSSIEGLFNYGLILEELGKEMISKDKEAEGNQFIKASTNQFETILDIDEAYSLAYYKLGFHYKHFQRYMKAGLIWNKFLVKSKDEILNQEIREEIDIIKDDAYFETGLTYLNYNNYEKALEAFLKLLPKHEDSWNVNFLIGQCYMGLGQHKESIIYMERAIDLNKSESDIYNELGIIYFNMGDINKAVKIFADGIENCPEDYKLYFNRGLGYIELENYDLGLKDVRKAHNLNPNDQNILEQRSLLEQFIQS